MLVGLACADMEARTPISVIGIMQVFQLAGMLGSEYCAGYLDSLGEWSTGFYCPSIAASLDVFCCGSLHTKYCCDSKDQVFREEVEG